MAGPGESKSPEAQGVHFLICYVRHMHDNPRRTWDAVGNMAERVALGAVCDGGGGASALVTRIYCDIMFCGAAIVLYVCTELCHYVHTCAVTWATSYT